MNKKVQVPAPEVVGNCTKFMGGVDNHEKLQSTFALGKQHKFKKYYVKLSISYCANQHLDVLQVE